ncbi:trpE operon leader peptide TrpLE [Ensifer sp. B1-9]
MENARNISIWWWVR